jgi:hypothetical protein
MGASIPSESFFRCLAPMKCIPAFAARVGGQANWFYRRRKTLSIVAGLTMRSEFLSYTLQASLFRRPALRGTAGLDV